MATEPKVKFKNIPELIEPGESHVMDFSTESTTVEDDHLSYYNIVLYTTYSPVDVKEENSIYLNEIRKTTEDYFDRFEVVKKYANAQLEEGSITGYILHGYKATPLKPGPCFIAMNKVKKFQVKKKTFLNGPLKDNEFIQKKGKHYA